MQTHNQTHNSNQLQVKLYEALVLLALHDEKGTTEGWYIEYTVAAAVLAELLMMNRVKVNADNKNKLEVIDAAPTGDLVMDEVLHKIATKKRPDTLKNWVMAIGHIPKLKHKVAEQLVVDGIIKSEEKKVLWVFTQKVYPEVNPEPERHLRHEMRRLILDKPLEIDAKVAILVALAKSAYLLKEVFSKDELKTHKERIDKIAKGEELGQITSEVVDAVQAAVMVAVMLPAMMAATTAATSSSSSSGC
ncbi:GPP34 family phosphoprotein [Pseudidiomarina sp. PP-1MA]|uniref:GPP34 family phosphoprotein n=1 Tax=Pseudidiomarina sp. PP-1MA TaxID=3237706 RepID=A0AB39X7Q8_9GAMM